MLETERGSQGRMSAKMSNHCLSFADLDVLRVSFNPAVKDRQDTPIPISEDERRAFEDAEKYLKYRKGLEDNFFRGFDGQLVDSESTKNAASNFTAAMRKRLTKAGRPELAESLIPDFPPHCRRLTPGPGYLEALAAENLTLIQTPIERSVSDTSGSATCADCVSF